MHVKKEDNNAKDESAMLICMPKLDEILNEFHHLVTRLKKFFFYPNNFQILIKYSVRHFAFVMLFVCVSMHVEQSRYTA